MSHSEVAQRIAGAAAPLVVPATAPAWGPPIIEVFGVDIPVASMVLSLIGLMMARGVSAAREGATPGGKYLTGTLAMVVVALVIERQPTPGMAIAWGVGIGASGILLFDLARDTFMGYARKILGRETK